MILTHFALELEKNADALTRKWARDGAKAAAAKALGETSAKNAAVNAQRSIRPAWYREAIAGKSRQLPVASKMEVEDLARKGEGLQARMTAATIGDNPAAADHLAYGKARMRRASGKPGWVSPDAKDQSPRPGPGKTYGGPKNNPDGHAFDRADMKESADRAVAATQFGQGNTATATIEMQAKRKAQRAEILHRREVNPALGEAHRQGTAMKLKAMTAQKTEAQVIGRPKAPEPPLGWEFGVRHDTVGVPSRISAPKPVVTRSRTTVDRADAPTRVAT